MAHGGNVIKELTADHREVEQMFRKIEKARAGSAERKTLADRLTMELVRHSVAEEQYLYPAVRDKVPNGKRMADKEIRDHGKIEEKLKELEGCAPDDRRFDRLIAAIEREVTAHVKDEEGRLFPSLAKACEARELDELGEAVRRAKKLAPTRPHPSAPTTPPANKLLGPGMGLVDRLRDTLSGRGSKRGTERALTPDTKTTREPQAGKPKSGTRRAAGATRATGKRATDARTTGTRTTGKRAAAKPTAAKSAGGKRTTGRRATAEWTAEGSTYADLYAEAKRRQIEGRSKMSKDELSRALSRR
jgi:hemerythrin superfamily protein